MLENIIFGLMVVAALGAAAFTCIYETGGLIHNPDKEQAKTQSDKESE
ncbi:MAG: hypothetical protein K2N73_12590 [Lachnospiraceae bacterium]|nr:hypothetical protein [Lachnospiraceae bacterium]